MHALKCFRSLRSLPTRHEEIGCDHAGGQVVYANVADVEHLQLCLAQHTRCTSCFH